MDEPISIHAAKTHLSRLIARAEAGEEIIIARGRTPVAKLVPIVAKPKRVPGRWKGQFTIPPEFYEPMSEEELALWYK
jgi:prevent-host-death family protein